MTSSTFRLLLPFALAASAFGFAGISPTAAAAEPPVPSRTEEDPGDPAVEMGSTQAAESVGNQIMVWNATDSQTASSYWQPALNLPSNSVSPINYAGGQAYIKITVETKPSNQSMKPLVCFWRHAETKFKYETCRAAATFSSTGSYYSKLGPATSWWKKGASYDWSVPPSLGRIMLAHPSTGKLFLTSKCGRACYTGGDLGKHVPVRMTSQLIFVAKGSTLAPPADWQSGCPSAWSAQCTG